VLNVLKLCDRGGPTILAFVHIINTSFSCHARTKFAIEVFSNLWFFFIQGFKLNIYFLVGVMWGVNCDLTLKGFNFIMHTTLLFSMKFELQFHLFLLLLCVDNES
jgi:hypothetical protein